MNLLTQCEKCKCNFDLSEDGTIEEREIEVKGQLMVITHFDCPLCRTRYYGQIDDRKSLGMRRELITLMGKMARSKQKTSTISKKQSTKMERLRRNLSEYRMQLKAEYNGKIEIEGKTVTFTM